MLNLYIRDPAFTYIIQKKKKYELRLLKGIFKDIKANDIICLCNIKTESKYIRKIRHIHIYNHFEVLLKSLKISNCLVNCRTMKDSLEYLDTIYEKSLWTKYKCIAIEFY